MINISFFYYKKKSLKNISINDQYHLYLCSISPILPQKFMNIYNIHTTNNRIIGICNYSLIYMEIIVDKSKTVAELLNQFNEMFPFLKLGIYFKGEDLSFEQTHWLLQKITSKRESSSFSIRPTMKVSELEQLFWEYMGIQITIFRKAGKSWLPTSYTSEWSLEHQNNKGIEMSEVFQ